MSQSAIEQLNAALGGRYRVERRLGEGGMATVYLADDLKHERKVALKVLKPELAAVVGAERFLAEIKTTANLQHPHILGLYDSGEAGGMLFYVMPYVEGESLRDRLDREHQLPVDDAVRIATNVAEALDYAHRQGVIHRDIKPANILLQDGKPVVADFGIALAVSAAGGARLTETGLSMGTPHYMSPEQASADREPTPTSDVYSLGCVLYEMLVGDPPHTASSAQAVLAKILTEDARGPAESRRAIPPNVDAATRRALEKLPADRFAGALSFAGALADPAFRHGGVEAITVGGVGSWNRATTGFAVLSAALATFAVYSRLASSDRPQLVTRFEVTLEESVRRPSTLALSPDGSRLVYVGSAPDGGVQLWQRFMDRLEPQPIEGSRGAFNPVFSPDGSSLGFMADGSIKTVSLSGGPANAVVDDLSMNSYVSMDWGDDGLIYFNDADSEIRRVPASGGATELLPITGRHVHALPDGQGLIFTRDGQITASSTDGESLTPLFPGLIARYASSGHLVYVTEEQALLAVPFDLSSRRVTGPAMTVGERVYVNLGQTAQFTLSASGTLAYMPDQGGAWELVKVARTGAVEVIHPDTGTPLLSLHLSPDETRIAMSIGVERNRVGATAEQDIWIKHLEGGPLTRLTSEGPVSFRPAWAPDGQRVAFISNRGGGFGVWTTRADGAGSAELLAAVDGPIYGASWSADGEWLFMQSGRAGTRNILAMRPGRDSVPAPLMPAGFDDRAPALSPDGRWLAYVSSESGGSNVFVRPFPNVEAGRWQVSQGGAGEPVWSHKGDELYYRARGDMVAAQVATTPEFRVVSSRVLFSATEYYAAGGNSVPVYSVGQDGEHFYMIRGSAVAPSDATVVLNFFEELKRLVPN
jgi:serine/threonine-protein kinase